MDVKAALGARVAVDTPAWIYFIEDHPNYAPVVAPLFEAAERGTVALVVSALTLMEVLVVPYRHGELAVAERYEALLTRSRGVTLAPLDLPVLRAAAALRGAAPSVRTPDALQLATALHHRCDSFVTNDRRLGSLPSLRVVHLDALGAPPA